MASNEPILEPLAEEKTEATRGPGKDAKSGTTGADIQEQGNRSNTEHATTNVDILRERKLDKTTKGMLMSWYNITMA